MIVLFKSRQSRNHLHCLILVVIFDLLVARIGGESLLKSNVGITGKHLFSKRLGSASVQSGGTTRFLQSSTAAPSSTSAGANDDIFRTSDKMKSARSEENQRFESFLEAGGCNNIECRVFLLVGYVAVGVGIAAAYRLARSAEWRLPPSVSQFERRVGSGQSVYDDEMTMAFRRKQWEDSKTVN